MSGPVENSPNTITLKDGNDNVVEYFKKQANKYIYFELINLGIVILITGLSIYFLGGGTIGEFGLTDSGGSLAISVANRAVFLTLLIFIARIFLRFQEYNTRRASLMRTIADAWSISDDKKEFQEMIKTLLPTQYESIKNFPDFKKLFGV